MPPESYIGIAIAALSVCAPITVAIIKLVPGRSRVVSNVYVRKEVCEALHTGLTRTIEEIKQELFEQRKENKELLHLMMNKIERMMQ